MNRLFVTFRSNRLPIIRRPNTCENYHFHNFFLESNFHLFFPTSQTNLSREKYAVYNNIVQHQKPVEKSCEFNKTDISAWKFTCNIANNSKTF